MYGGAITCFAVDAAEQWWTRAEVARPAVGAGPTILAGIRSPAGGCEITALVIKYPF